MQMKSSRYHGLRTFLSRSKRVQFLSGLFLNASIIAFVFVISFMFDYCYLWVLRWVFVNVIGLGGSVGGVLAFVQAFSLYGAMILYFLTLAALVIFHLMNYNKMLWRAEPESLKFKAALSDTGEAFLDALCLFIASLVILALVASLLFFIHWNLSGSSFLRTFETGTAVFLAAGYTGIFALALARYVEDLFEKLFGISLWQRVRKFFRRRFSRKLSGRGGNIP